MISSFLYDDDNDDDPDDESDDDNDVVGTQPPSPIQQVYVGCGTPLSTGEFCEEHRLKKALCLINRFFGGLGSF